MKKEMMMMVMMMIAMAFFGRAVMAETFDAEAPVKWSQQRLSNGGFLITLDGPLDIPDGVLYVFHQDSLRGLNVKKNRIEPMTFTPTHKEWVVNEFTVKVRQNMFNLYSPKLNRWFGIPSPLVGVGDGLSCGYTYPSTAVEHEGEWDKPGGTAIVLTAAGIPADYPVSCSGGNGGAMPNQQFVHTPILTPPAQSATPARHAAVPSRKYHRLPNGNICESPCIQEIRADVKEIKADVKEVKKDVKYVKKYVRKTYKKVKIIDKSLGRPKDGKTSVHEKLDRIEKKLGTSPAK